MNEPTSTFSKDNSMNVELFIGDYTEGESVSRPAPLNSLKQNLFDAITYAMEHPEEVAQVAPPAPNYSAHPVVGNFVNVIDTGSVKADTMCFGAVWSNSAHFDHSTMMLMSAIGSRSGIGAVRARIQKPDDFVLSVGNHNFKPDANEIYLIFEKMSKQHSVSHMMALHPAYQAPVLHDMFEFFQYFMDVDTGTTMRRMGSLVSDMTGLPVYPEWLNYLWVTGTQARLIQQCAQVGGIPLSYSIQGPASHWSTLISQGLANNIIQIPTL